MDLNQVLRIEGLRVEIFHWLAPHEATVACQSCKLFLKFFQHDDYWKTKIDEHLCSSVSSQQLMMNPCIRTFAQDQFGLAVCKRVDWLFSLNYKHSLTVFADDLPLPSLWRYVYQVLVFMERAQMADDGGLSNWIHIVNEQRNSNEHITKHDMYKRILLVQRKLFAVYPFLRGLRPYLSNDSSLAKYFSEDPSRLYQEKVLNSSRTSSFIGCTTLYTFEKSSLTLRLITSNASGGGAQYSATIMEIGLFQSSGTIQAVLYMVHTPGGIHAMRLIAVEQLSWSNFLVSTYPFQSLVTYLGFKELQMSQTRPLIPAMINNPQEPMIPKSQTSKAFENTVKVCIKLILKQIGTSFFPDYLIKDLDNLFREKSKKRPSRTAAACLERLLRRIIRRILEDKMLEYTQLFTQQRDLELDSFRNSSYLTNSETEFMRDITRGITTSDSAVDRYAIYRFNAGLNHSLFRFACETKSTISYRPQYVFFYPLVAHLDMYSQEKEHQLRTIKFGSRYPPGFYAWASALLVPMSKLVVYHITEVMVESSHKVESEEIKKIFQEMDDIAKFFEMTSFRSRFSDKRFLGGKLSSL